ncbi:hypothetical protein [Maliponia aquimaris]|nr:hypothetical protein [Maliponia aquimaris]
MEVNLRVDGARGHVVLTVWRFSDGRRLLCGRPEGYLGREDLIRAMEQLVDHPGIGAALPTLWDFRGYDFAAYGVSEFRLHAFIMPKFPARLGVRRGYLVDSDTGYGTLRMFQGAASGFNFENQDNLLVSYKLEELVAWLLP